MSGSPLPPKSHPPVTFRLVDQSMGMARSHVRGTCSRVLADPGGVTHKHKGTFSRHLDSQEPCTAWGGGQPVCRQPSSIQLATCRKGWRLPHLNSLLRPFLQWCVNTGVQLQVRWDVFELPRGIHAQAKMAPSLHSVVRGLLERDEVPPAVATAHLRRLSALPRYDSAFRLLWALLQEGGLPPQASLGQVAAAIVQLHQVSPSQARNAYSAMLLIPGYSQLKFSSLLQMYRREWNHSA